MWIRISKLLLTIKNIALIGVGISLCIALINTLISLGAMLRGQIFKDIAHTPY
ncbi:MAG: Protein PsiE [Veillonella sp. DORA_A_3_16_22]|nr:MAG: Protein PsiE [Veillonella sp. DORA_A_3_16_22]